MATDGFSNWTKPAGALGLWVGPSGSEIQVVNSAGMFVGTFGNITNANIANSAAIALFKLAALTASRALVSDGSGIISASAVTASELAFLTGVTSAIQTQLNAKQATGNYITALTGQVTASGPGSVAATIANNVITNAMIASAAAIAYSKLSLSNSILNADINSAAAIAYSKLSMANSIVNTDINSAAAIAYSKLNLATSIVNADINASAAISYSKLNLAGAIVNTDISASAAIAYSKLALSNSIVNADINTAAAIAYSKLSLGSSIVNADIAAAAAIAGTKISPNFGTQTVITGGPIGSLLNSSASTGTLTAQTSNGGFLRYTGASAKTVTGFVAPATTIAQTFYVLNTASTITFANASATETTAANRISTGVGGDVTFGPGLTTFVYDPTSSVWRMQSSAFYVQSVNAHRNGTNGSLAPNNSAVNVNFNSTTASGIWGFVGLPGYSTGSGNFVIPYTGRYRVDAKLGFLNTNVLASKYRINITRGASFAGSTTVATGTSTVPLANTSFNLALTEVLNLTAGDVMWVSLDGDGNNSASQVTMSGDVNSSHVTWTYEGLLTV